MSKKLLSEAEFRKFAKLANLESLAEKKIDEIYSLDEEPVEEEVSFDEDDTLEEEEEGMGMEDEPMPGMEDEPPAMDDMGGDGEGMLSTEDAQSVAAALPAMEKIAAAVGADGMEDDELEGELVEDVVSQLAERILKKLEK